jgi:hypothetical protein
LENNLVFLAQTSFSNSTKVKLQRLKIRVIWRVWILFHINVNAVSSFVKSSLQVSMITVFIFLIFLYFRLSIIYHSHTFNM